LHVALSMALLVNSCVQ